MQTISEVIERRLQTSAFITDALQEGLINTSALARYWQESLSEEDYKDVSIGALNMAIRRALKENRRRIKRRSFPVRRMTLVPRLTEMVFRANPRMNAVHRRLLTEQQKIGEDETYLHFSQGTQEVAFIVSENLRPMLQKLTAKEEEIDHYDNLSMISLLFPPGTASEAGVYYPYIQALAWEGISFVEVIAMSSEQSFFFEEHFVEKAMAVLKRLSA